MKINNKTQLFQFDRLNFAGIPRLYVDSNEMWIYWNPNRNSTNKMQWAGVPKQKKTPTNSREKTRPTTTVAIFTSDKLMSYKIDYVWKGIESVIYVLCDDWIDFIVESKRKCALEYSVLCMYIGELFLASVRKLTADQRQFVYTYSWWRRMKRDRRRVDRLGYSYEKWMCCCI